MALTWLLASRIFAGACGANIAVAAAYIADITPPEKRSKGMGLIGVAFGLGFILGPALGAFSAHAFGLAGPGWVAAGLCGANFVLAWAILAESRRPGGAVAEARPRMRQISHTLRLPRVGLLVNLYFLSTFCFAVFETTLPLLLGSPGFHPDDFVDPRGFARKLTSPGASEEQEAAAVRVVTRLTPGFRERLQDASAMGTTALRGEFFREFNRLLDLPDLFAGTEVRAAEEETGRGVQEGPRSWADGNGRGTLSGGRTGCGWRRRFRARSSGEVFTLTSAVWAMSSLIVG
ncbi:MAG: MFS transporter [Verrucomicrobia bacterium]|nr:MFS transporter [Verrucomicrobiota bacterium]